MVSIAMAMPQRDGVTTESVTMTSRRGIRLAGMLHLPAGARDPAGLPTVVLCHGMESTKEQRDAYLHTLSRYIAVKEEEAKLVEHEIVILWTDYFRPEHAEANPGLHDLVWKTCKLTSTVKQSINMQAGQDLLAGVQQIAELFWKTKGVQTKRQASGQPTGGEIVYPVA